MIVTDEKILRQISTEVDFEEIKEIHQALLDEVSVQDRAVGLSAIQIGIPKRVFITRDGVSDNWTLWVNPQLKKCEDEYSSKPNIIEFIEGCLSFPGRTVKTKRYDSIVVSNLVQRIENEPARELFALDGIDSVVFQHELDHLNGKTMFDRGFELYIPVTAEVVLGRNEPCHCNSGKKFKKCCGK